MADYPPLIYLDRITEMELINFINTELYQHYFERSVWLDKLVQMQHSYWAEPDDAEVTFPFYGASNIVIPLNAIAVEAIQARAMTTVFGMDQLVSARALSPDWVDAAKPVEQFLNKELLDNVQVYKPINDTLLELIKYGTGILKSGYTKITKLAVRDGEEFEVVVKEGATLESVPLSRFIMPFADLDAQLSQWCGEEHSMTPFQIEQLEAQGFFYKGTYKKVVVAVSQQGSYQEREFEDSQERLEKREILLPSRVNFQEIYLAWNTDRNTAGKRREIVIHYQRETNTVMGVRYNWYSDLHRPYRTGVYFPIEHRWTGIGVIKQNEAFQEEITTKHRQFLDNATLANMRMIKVSRMSGIQPGEPIFPGKMWFLDDMTHLETVQMGEVYPSAYNTEQATLMFSQQRTGVNELTLGQQQAGTPGTASDTLARIQEGNKKFGYCFRNMKNLITEGIRDVACNIQQFGPRSVKYYDTTENGNLVREFFDMPEEYIRENLLIELKAAGQLDNKLLDRQNYMQMGQLYQQYIEGLLNLATQTQDPNMIQEIIQKGMYGATEIMKQIFESFDLRNIDRIVINLMNNGQTQQMGNAGIGALGQGLGLPNINQNGQPLSGLSLPTAG